MKKKITFSLILILVGSFMLIIDKIIDEFDWHLKSDFIFIASFMITLGIFLLGVFLLKNIKNKGFKIFLNIFWTLIIIVAVFIEFMLLSWIIKTTIIKEIDGVKYCGVEYLSNRLRKDVYYYKDYNIFAYHKTEEYIEEFYDYDDYEQPEWREYHKVPLTDSIIYYYDEDGNITDIKTYNENGAIVDVNKEKEFNIQYNYSYGEIFEIVNNTIYYGEVKEEKTNYLSQELSDNYKIIDFESENVLNSDDIAVGDYVSLYVPTAESQNGQAIIIVTKKNYVIEQIERKLLNKKEFSAELTYYNEDEKYITVGIALEDKKIENFNVQPIYYLDLSVGETTETYLGNKENNLNSNYGYQVNELCIIELMSNIEFLPNKYIVKSIEFIAD